MRPFRVTTIWVIFCSSSVDQALPFLNSCASLFNKFLGILRPPFGIGNFHIYHLNRARLFSLLSPLHHQLGGFLFHSIIGSLQPSNPSMLLMEFSSLTVLFLALLLASFRFIAAAWRIFADFNPTINQIHVLS